MNHPNKIAETSQNWIVPIKQLRFTHIIDELSNKKKSFLRKSGAYFWFKSCRLYFLRELMTQIDMISINFIAYKYIKVPILFNLSTDLVKIFLKSDRNLKKCYIFYQYHLSF